ncbi:hypothetical protein SSX86_015074 [Deinandra increscens subsp. villosa]|uniref:Growth-regulating factor n=1 Tax=Deinandra increscens subsp. villosa TaxID=3103831 RepID=A0AAP0D3C1_9ASTR
MDFGGLDGLLCSDTTHNNNNNNHHSVISAYDLDSKPKSCGFKHEQSLSVSATSQNQDEWREIKVPKLNQDDFSKGGNGMMLLQPQRSNSHSVFSDSQNMLSFSSPNTQWTPTLPYYARNTNESDIFLCGFVAGLRGVLAGVRGPFTPSQWMELEHQALIYKYITVNAPIPSNLIIPIRKALETAAFCSYPGANLRRSSYGWGGLHMGFSNNSDPEPGRCRRTDGKKWRCSRDAVADQKYCERHMNRGRHRSRKPVEPVSNGPTTTAAAIAAAKVAAPAAAVSNVVAGSQRQHQHQMNLKQPIPAPAQSEFGFVCSDSLLNPLTKPENSGGKPENRNRNPLHQFMDDWPRPEGTQLSISIPMSSSEFLSTNASPIGERLKLSPLRMGLGVGNTNAHKVFDEMPHPTNWIPVSWEASSGGPLGEVLNHNTGCTSNSPSALNLMTDGWESSHQQMTLSPTGVLQKTGFGCFSNSSAGSSPRTDNSLIGSALMSSSLPLL